MTQRSGPLLYIAFSVFAVAAILLAGLVAFSGVGIIVAPVALVVLVVAAALGAIMLWTASPPAVALLAGVVWIMIDLGFGIADSVAHGIKALAYLVAWVAGLRSLFGAERSRIPAVTKLIVVYALLCWATVIYSVERLTTAYTGFALVALALVSARLSTLEWEHAERALRIAAITSGVMVTLSLLYYIVLPGFAVARNVAGDGRVSGLFGSPNSAGGVTAITIILNFAQVCWPSRRSMRGRLLAGAFVLVAAAMLALSGSRNAMAACLVSCTALLALRWPRTAVVGLLAGALLSLVISATIGWEDLLRGVVRLVSRTRSGADVSNLTGRTDIWAFVLREWQQSPWIGYGLAGTRSIISEGWASVWGKTTGTAHNALLESLLDIGILGTLLLVAVYVFTIRELLRAARMHAAGPGAVYAAAAVILFSIMFGLAEKSAAGAPSTSTGAIFLAAAVAGIGARGYSRRLAAANANRTRLVVGEPA